MFRLFTFLKENWFLELILHWSFLMKKVLSSCLFVFLGALSFKLISQLGFYNPQFQLQKISLI
jgi:hypothetical protein